MRPMTKHLIIVVLILVVVTVASLGIRRIHFRADKAGTVEGPVIVETEIEQLIAELETVDAWADQRYNDTSKNDEEVRLEDYSKAKPVKGDYAKAKDSKGLQKISLGENENLYITENGATWYVSKGPDGKTTKMLVQINEATGEMNVIDIGSSKSGGLKPIPMGDGYNMYITEEGQTWYVGGGSKERGEADDTTGEITILEHYDSGGQDDK